MRFDLLIHGVHVDADEEVTEALRYLSQSARCVPPPVEEMPIRVVRVPSGLRITVKKRPIGTVRDTSRVFQAVYRRVHSEEFRALREQGCFRIHAATASVGGSRLIVAGRSGAGKTTLALRLLLDGHAVQGDELAVLRPTGVSALPRRFHVKAGAIDLLPELAPHLAGEPELHLKDGRRILGFDPGCAGFDWTLDTKPLDHIVLLAGGHDSPTDLTSDIPKAEAMEQLATNLFSSDWKDRTWVRALVLATEQARCHRLVVGHPAEASAALAQLVEA